MRNIYFLLLFFAFKFSAFSQVKNSFSLNGKTTDLSGYIYLSYMNAEGKSIQDSSLIQNGSFRFNGIITEPTNAYLKGPVKSRSVDDPNFTGIFLEPAVMNVEVNMDQFKSLVMRGSKSQDEQRALEKLKSPVMRKMEPVLLRYKNEKNREKAAAIRDEFEPFNARMEKIDYQFFKDHPDSYVSAYNLRFRISNLTLDSLSLFYNNFSKKIKESNYGKEIASEIEKLRSGSEGSIAKNFTATDIKGRTISLADFKENKYVLLDFWASWCVPCRKGNPHLLELYSKYSGKGLEIIGIADDDTQEDKWKKAVSQDGIGIWKHVLRGLKRTATGFDRSADLSEKYGIRSLPTKILIDRNGVIIGRFSEEEAPLDAKLATIFK